jgi:ankyrin repeat protein
MKERIGGNKVLERISEDIIQFGNKVNQKSQLNNNNHDLFNSFTLDLYEACEKLRVYKVVMILSTSSAEDISNIKTPEEEPLFLHNFQRAIKMDSISNRVNIGDEKYDNGERKKLQKVLDLFVQYNSDINADNGKDQLAPIHMAIIANNIKMLHWCMVHKANKELITKYEKLTPLMLAAKYGYIEILAELIKHEVDMEYKHVETGMNALHIAASFGQTRVALFLLRIGMNKKIKDSNNRTAAQIASEG